MATLLTLVYRKALRTLAEKVKRETCLNSLPRLTGSFDVAF